MLKFVFTKLSMCRPVHLSTCLPVHHVQVKVKICIHKTFNVSTCLPVHHIHTKVKICIYNTFNMSTCLPVHLSTCPPCTCKSKKKQSVYVLIFLRISVWGILKPFHWDIIGQTRQQPSQRNSRASTSKTSRAAPLRENLRNDIDRHRDARDP